MSPSRKLTGEVGSSDADELTPQAALMPVPITLRQFALGCLILVAIIVLTFATAFTVYLKPILDRSDATAHRIELVVNRQSCNGEANGKVWQAVADSFDVTASSDAAARDKAVQKIRDAAKLFDACR